MARQRQHCEYPTAVRSVELDAPVRALTDVSDSSSVRVFVTLAGRLLGSVEIPNRYQPISATRLREAIADGIDVKLLEGGERLSVDDLWDHALTALKKHFVPGDEGSARLPVDVSVSVVLATRDRPDNLRACLACLTKQNSSRPVEIVVVDNNPHSGLTAPVVAEFPAVVLVNEWRQGLSYARNKGFITATGDISVTTDDDVTMPPDWLEKLLVPFVRSDVAAVTGNILPLKLDTAAQNLYEIYGGLGRGFEWKEADSIWFRFYKRRPVPTWKLGATANAAFRSAIFCHPQIGLLDEALGVGTPTGCSEDTYLFYKIIKAGYTLVYNPDAFVWHRHRKDMQALRRQIYDYSKGHIAYHLTTLVRDHDLRALTRLLAGVFRSHWWRIKQRLRGRSDYPVSLVMLEILGNMAGPFALWRSLRRVKREGRSEHYVPVAQRSSTVVPISAGKAG